jgi:hypothetical protein
MTPTDVRARVLTRLQTELQSIYRVDSPLSVADFAITRAQWKDLARDGTAEELLIREQDGELEVAVFVDDDVLHTIDRAPGHWTHSRLRAHCLAVEGVSHFLYLTHRAQMPRPVSQLELELQAEIDKFATVLLALWEAGNRAAASALRTHLFESVSFKPELSSEENDRYRQANFLASLYCRFLEMRYVVKNSIDGFLADLRRMYRLGAGEKLSYAACGAAL